MRHVYDYSSHTTNGSDNQADGDELLNTIGDVPRAWYRNEQHIGYGRSGVKLRGSDAIDGLDSLLRNIDDRSSWRQLFYDTSGQQLRLSSSQIALLQKLESGVLPSSGYVEFSTQRSSFSQNQNQAAEPKRRFLPSRFEARKVLALVRRLRKSFSSPKQSVSSPHTNELTLDIWGTPESNESLKCRRTFGRAPRSALAGNAESYNAPSEYVLDGSNLVSNGRKSLRTLAANPNFIKECFNRCLDLYLCPRVEKQTLQMEPDSLLPRIPNPADLKPFPTLSSTRYIDSKDEICSISVDTTGTLLASGSSGGRLKVWDILSSRCLRTLSFTEPIACVAWRPGPLQQVAVSSGENVHIITLKPVLHHYQNRETHDEAWSEGDFGSLVIRHTCHVSKLSWHSKGDYFLTVAKHTGKLFVHRLATRTTQVLFGGDKNVVSNALFHPFETKLITITQYHIRIFDIRQQHLLHKIKPGNSSISCLSVNEYDGSIMVGTNDSKLFMFDVEVSSIPSKVIQLPSGTVVASSFHKRLPLFHATLSTGSTHIFHWRLANDTLRTPTIVPLKVLTEKSVGGTVSASDCVFHETQPWIFSAWGSRITLFVEERIG
jgi:ribosome biogenesis protein ERB1|mmetsp:Transcript_1328/g.4179  ORF Transcript_1328/g.4179 Transcript_1328/m.4179 type:complete len:602 (+) Transcript_1328:93-1898(+)